MCTVKRDTQIRAIKITNDKANHTRLPRLGHKHWLARPLGLGRKHRLARPFGLGRKPRLARPPLASGASSASSDPSRARAPTLLRPNPQNKASSTRRPYPRRDGRSDSHIAAGHGGDYSNHHGHCSLTSLTMLPYLFHCGVPTHSERGMGEINQRHYWLSSPTVTGQAAVSPIRPPMTSTGLGDPP